ncbi:MAG: hypothetical protein H7X70_00490 [Candidatus Kapabacteria bacterium]|nr:hypothetical protein [Candidatus Kapabacteria bacterium]
MRARYFILCLLLARCGWDVCANTIGEYDEAIKAMQKGNYAEAKALLEKCIVGGADNLDTWHAMGFVGQGLKDYELMERAGRRITTIDPLRVEGWYFQCISFARTRHYDSLVPVAKKMIQIDPKSGLRTKVDAILSSLSQDPLGSMDSNFCTPDCSVQLTLPRSWTAQLTDDGKLLNWYVSLDLKHEDEDQFLSGVTIQWVRGLSSSFPFDANTDPEVIIDYWKSYQEGQQTDRLVFFQERIDSTPFQIGAWRGERITTDIQVSDMSYRLRKHDIVLARPDEVLTFTFETPSDAWPVYQSRFEAAIASMIVPK